MSKNASIIIQFVQNAIQEYARVSSMSGPAVKHLSSHLSMVHGLNGHECVYHLTNAVLCPTTKSPPVQPLRPKAEKAKLKNSPIDKNGE